MNLIRAYFSAFLIVCLFSLGFPLGLSAQTNVLPRSSPEAEGISSDGIYRLLEAWDKDPGTLHGFMLLRNGKAVAEGSWKPYRKQDPHVLFSVSKSFTSAAIGMAIEEGLLNLDDLVISFFPELVPVNADDHLKAMRIRDLLTMTSGHGEDTINKLLAEAGNGMTKAFLALPVEHKPGIHFQYNTGNTYMLSAILQKVSGEKLAEYLGPRLFEPLGIEHPHWQQSPEGVNFGGFGLFINTEAIARFGQLYLQKGEWNGRRLLSEDWVIQSSARQVSNGSNPMMNGEQGYGYHFWRNREVGYRADGIFGQFCFVLPEHNMVLAITAGHQDMDKITNQVWEYLLPAVFQEPLQENPQALEQLNKKLGQLRVDPIAGKKSAPIAKRASGKVYHFEENELGINSIKFDFDKKNPQVVFSTAEGENAIPFEYGNWKRDETSLLLQLAYLNDEKTPVISSGAWISDDTLELVIRYYHTQLSLNLRFKFAGNLLVFEGEQNVSFGPTKLSRMLGEQ